MFYLNFIFWSFLLVYNAAEGQNLRESITTQLLPSWITSNQAFKNPTKIDSISTGNGSISIKGKKDISWLIHVNDKIGYGIEIDVESLSLKPDSNEHLMIAEWPLIPKNLNEVKVFTGQITKRQKLRISNAMTFFVLYSSVTDTDPQSKLSLSYRRCGVSLEKNPPTTESPVKKETVFEVQFKGIPPKEYFNSDFMDKVKEGMRSSAKTYCQDNNIPFNDSLPTNQMVFIHRISFCPFEWPDRDICVSLQHSIFVSGIRVPNGYIMDYQLIAEHLQNMWMGKDHPELNELGITIFKLPEASTTILWWILITGLAMGTSLVGIMLLWKVGRYSREVGVKRKLSETSEVSKSKKKPKLKLARHQRIPSFIYSNKEIDSKMYEEPVMKTVTAESLLKEARLGAAPQEPMKNYIGSLLFSTNRAFEDDEENNEELQAKKQLP